jgi:predicted DNA-binding transcriptional regulator YafY
MLETSARLLRLLSLLQSRRYWEGAGLAERLEITPRTLRRDEIAEIGGVRLDTGGPRPDRRNCGIELARGEMGFQQSLARRLPPQANKSGGAQRRGDGDSCRA